MFEKPSPRVRRTKVYRLEAKPHNPQRRTFTSTPLRFAIFGHVVGGKSASNRAFGFTKALKVQPGLVLHYGMPRQLFATPHGNANRCANRCVLSVVRPDEWDRLRNSVNCSVSSHHTQPAHHTITTQNTTLASQVPTCTTYQHEIHRCYLLGPPGLCRRRASRGPHRLRRSLTSPNSVPAASPTARNARKCASSIIS